MTGRSSGRKALLLAGALLVFVVTVETARTEVLKGQSRELGIQFEVTGGADWCAPYVVVALNAAKADAFKPETLQFVQMLGRIRAVIMDQCPRVERIAFDAAAQQRAVMSIEMTRLTKWRRLVRIEPATRRPICPTKQQDAECDKRIDAYLLTHKLMRGDPFAMTELTSFLEEEAGAHAVWRSNDVTGKLTIKKQSDYAGRFMSGNQLAGAAMHALRMLCSREGGRPDLLWSESWPRPTQEEAAVRGFSCHPPTGVAEHRALIVSLSGTTFYVFAFLASGADTQAARAAARDLALAIGASP